MYTRICGRCSRQLPLWVRKETGRPALCEECVTDDVRRLLLNNREEDNEEEYDSDGP